jgi:hypothetical protein
LSDKDWSDWSSAELSEELVIMYQKKADSLPVTTFAVTLEEPCMDPKVVASQKTTDVEFNSY